jgi:hypothetical protein
MKIHRCPRCKSADDISGYDLDIFPEIRHKLIQVIFDDKTISRLPGKELTLRPREIEMINWNGKTQMLCNECGYSEEADKFLTDWFNPKYLT